MNTFGWDTVFVTDIAHVNEALKKESAAYIEKFEMKAKDFQGSGVFGPWEIVPGGSGTLLQLKVPIVHGTLRMPGASEDLDVSGVEVLLTVSLKLLPDPAKPNSHRLLFDFEKVGDHDPSKPGGGVVSFNKATAPPGSKLTSLQETVIGTAVATVLVQNADKVSFEFASIDPMAVANAKWLQPKRMAYAYADVVGTGAQMLAILCVNDDRDISQLPSHIDPALLAPGQSAGLAVSERLVLQNVLIPGLAKAFNTSEASFKVGPVPSLKVDGVLLAKAFNLKSVSAAGETYTPSVSALRAVIQDTHIAVSLSGHCSMGMDITMDFQASSTMAVAFSAPEKTFKFSTVGKPVFAKQTHIPWYDHLVDIAGGLAEIILQVTVAAISGELGGGIAQLADAKKIGTYAPNVVGWLGGTGFTPAQGGLATSLYLRGQLI